MDPRTKTIYLCGPINGCTDDEATTWREQVKAWARGHSERVQVDLGKWERYDKLACIDPMRRDYRGSEAADYREIVDLDKADVRRADLVLVNYVKPSVGTSMETLYGWELGKPVLTWHTPHAILPPWLRYHSTTLVWTFGMAKAAIRRMLDLDSAPKA